jgi:hypothetical protein
MSTSENHLCFCHLNAGKWGPLLKMLTIGCNCRFARLHKNLHKSGRFWLLKRKVGIFEHKSGSFVLFALLNEREEID